MQQSKKKKIPLQWRCSKAKRKKSVCNGNAAKQNERNLLQWQCSKAKRRKSFALQALLEMQATASKLCCQRSILGSIFEQVKHEHLMVTMRAKRIRHLLSGEDEARAPAKPLTCRVSDAAIESAVLGAELSVSGIGCAALGTEVNIPGTRSTCPGTRTLHPAPSASRKRIRAMTPAGM